MLKTLKNKIFCCIEVLTLAAQCTIFFNKKQFAVCVWAHEKEEDKMNKAKSVFAISFAAVAFGLVACGDDSSSGVSPDQESYVSSSDSEVPASSGDVVGESSSSVEVKSSDSGKSGLSSSLDAESSSSVKPDTSSVVSSSSAGPGSSSSVIPASSSSVNAVSVDCQKYEFLNEEVPCDVAEGRCYRNEYRCDDGQAFADIDEFYKFVMEKRVGNSLYAENCKVDYLCVDGTDRKTGELAGGCFPVETCPVIAVCDYRDSAGKCISFEQHVQACRESATAGTACVVDEINHGYQNVVGCDFFCTDGKWEYLPPPTSNTEPGNSSSKEEIYWWQEPCSVEGEQKKQDFGDAIDTYECNDGKWKIINKEFPNCDAFTDC